MAVQAVLHCMRQPSCAVRPPNSFLLLCMRKNRGNDQRNAVHMSCSVHLTLHANETPRRR